jgi:hypothetical protein
MFFRVNPEHLSRNRSASVFMFLTSAGVKTDGDVTYQLPEQLDPLSIARALWEMAAQVGALAGVKPDDLRVVAGANPGDGPDEEPGPADGVWFEVRTKQDLAATERRHRDKEKEFADRAAYTPGARYDRKDTLYLSLSYHTLRLQGSAPVVIHTEYVPGRQHVVVEVPHCADPFRFAAALWELATKAHIEANRLAGVLEIKGYLVPRHHHLVWRVSLVKPTQFPPPAREQSVLNSAQSVQNETQNAQTGAQSVQNGVLCVPNAG